MPINNVQKVSASYVVRNSEKMSKFHDILDI